MSVEPSNRRSRPAPHVLITGASSGIGRALAKEFGAAGCSLTLVARRGDLLRELAAELDQPTTVIEHDLNSAGDSGELLSTATEASGPVDLLINNAGMAPVLPYEDMEQEYERAAVRLNLLVPLELIRATLPAMIGRGAGTIINITSIAALLPTPYMSAYNAGKAGLAAFSESLGVEIRPRGVGVLTVYPGVIETPLAEAGYVAHGHSRLVTRMPRGTPQTLARRIHRAVERRTRRLIYPSQYKIAWWMPWLGRPLLERVLPVPVRPTTSDNGQPLG